MTLLDATHAADLRSWVTSANDGSTDFPIQNLPFGVFRRRRSQEAFRGGVAIGDQILDLAAAVAIGAFSGEARDAAVAASRDRLNDFMALGPSTRSVLRQALSRALREGAAEQARLTACLVAQDAADYALPAAIGDFTDFYIGIHHATAIGRLFRPNAPLLPNYKWVPIGYHGRSSSVVVSGEPIYRPFGQSKGPSDTPEFGPSRRVDYELELGFLIGPGNRRGERIPIERAESHLFGVTLFNDWSARDIQPWEYQPLGPFLSKNFGSTMSPWVVTLEALAPFRVGYRRPPGDVEPLPYLSSEGNSAEGGLDIQLEVLLQTEKMRAEGNGPELLARSSFADAAYWTPAQLVAHHTVGGCNLTPGDLLGSGTLSGSHPTQAGSLIERTKDGKEPLLLCSGEQRTFLQDGDTVVFRGWCERTGARRIGFGQCVGTVRAPGTLSRG
jgi:fumarylacetoacetase